VAEGRGEGTKLVLDIREGRKVQRHGPGRGKRGEKQFEALECNRPKTGGAPHLRDAFGGGGRSKVRSRTGLDSPQMTTLWNEKAAVVVLSSRIWEKDDGAGGKKNIGHLPEGELNRGGGPLPPGTDVYGEDSVFNRLRRDQSESLSHKGKDGCRGEGREEALDPYPAADEGGRRLRGRLIIDANSSDSHIRGGGDGKDGSCLGLVKNGGERTRGTWLGKGRLHGGQGVRLAVDGWGVLCAGLPGGKL